MCLLVMAWQAHPRYRLVVAANRDEFHDRPAAPFASWKPPDEIIAGRDLRAGGTWLAVDRGRRFGVVTNFRELQRPAPGAPSRGELIPGFLRAARAVQDGTESAPSGTERAQDGTEPAQGTSRIAPDALRASAGAAGSAAAYFASLASVASSYSGFNLLLADARALWYGSNRAPQFATRLSPGVYGLSNQLLDTPWPKLRRVRQRFGAWLTQTRAASTEELLAILDDRIRAGPDEQLPDTGLSREWEQVLSSPFVSDPIYGTRCSTVLLLEAGGALHILERRFDSRGECSGETEFRLAAGDWV